jgi:predicted RNA-binding Zn-ribbon protein involved in translation (DUF1610 family)
MSSYTGTCEEKATHIKCPWCGAVVLTDDVHECHEQLVRVSIL